MYVIYFTICTAIYKEILSCLCKLKYREQYHLLIAKVVFTHNLNYIVYQENTGVLEQSDDINVCALYTTDINIRQNISVPFTQVTQRPTSVRLWE